MGQFPRKCRFASGGGGQKTRWTTPSPNFEELIESITLTNMLFFFSGGSRKKSYELSKLGGGGGGGGVTRKLVRAKIGPGGPLFAAETGPTPDHFWLLKLVRVAKRGPGVLTSWKSQRS